MRLAPCASAHSTHIEYLSHPGACLRPARREKLFNYFDIEPRYVMLTEDCFVAPPEKIVAACDENTIGVVAILGTTYSGHFEDVEGIDKAISVPLLPWLHPYRMYTIYPSTYPSMVPAMLCFPFPSASSQHGWRACTCEGVLKMLLH